MYQLTSKKTSSSIDLSARSIENIFSYKAHTKFPFLLIESVVFAQLLKEGLSDNEIRVKIVDDNLLQIRSSNSREGVLGILKQLTRDIPMIYIEFLATGNIDLRRYTLLFLTMRINRLLRETSSEVLLDKLKSLEISLDKRNLQTFFDLKYEQEPIISQWSTSTYQKVCSNIILVLIRSGLLVCHSSKKCYEIQSMPVPVQLRKQLQNDGLELYVKLMLN
jgi:Putative inner membrane protein (DUF1819)